MKRWLMVGILTVPAVASAECGWFFMIPNSVGSGLQTGSIDQWRQFSAHDSARDCEEIRLAAVTMSSKKLSQPEQLRAMDQARIGNYPQLDPNERAYVVAMTSRCLPTDQVPIR